MSDNKETNRNRATMAPGGCECSKCGCVFIGGETHTECGICANETKQAPAVEAGARDERAALITERDGTHVVVIRGDEIVYSQFHAAATGQEPIGYMRPDELAKARIAPNMCRVHPAKDKQSDMIPIYAAPIGDTRAQIEAEQRHKMQERFAQRPQTPATADFDLPAPNDPIGDNGAKYKRIEQLRKALFESRDAMRVMSNWVKKSDPAGYSWGTHMVDRANMILNGESNAQPADSDSGASDSNFTPLTEGRQQAIADSVEQRYGETLRGAVDLACSSQPAKSKQVELTSEYRSLLAKLANGLELTLKLAAERACISDELVMKAWIKDARALLARAQAKGE